jgi:hypothetical protein
MIPNGKAKMTKVVMAFLIAGSISLVGTGQALAKKVIVRPGDRVVYRGYGSSAYDVPYGSYGSTPPPASYSVPPPWAASWYRSRHWRNQGKDNWRHDWQRHRGARD